MKKVITYAIAIGFAIASCNQKNKETTTDNSQMMDNDGTMMHNDSTVMHNNNTMMDNQTKIYSCPMHPEVQGKLNDKCSKCGMKLTEPVTEKTVESK